MALLRLGLILLISLAAADTEYKVGAGIWDVTGPAAEINMVSTDYERHKIRKIGKKKVTVALVIRFTHLVLLSITIYYYFSTCSSLYIVSVLLSLDYQY